MEPRSHEEHIRHTFDAFCKKVLRNEARDYLDELARRRSREISFSELPVEVMEQLSVCDDYFAEDRTLTFSAISSRSPATSWQKRLHPCQQRSATLSCFHISLK